LTFNTNFFENDFPLIITAPQININGIAGTLTVQNDGALIASGNNASINITSPIGQNLVISTSAPFFTGTMDATGSGSPQINLFAPLPTPGNPSIIEFAGNQNFNAPTIASAAGPNQFIELDFGVTITGAQLLWLKAQNFVNFGGSITGNPLLF